MTSPYLISPATWPMDIDPPATGKHISSSHNGSANEWNGVVAWVNNSTQCMWCHNVDGGDAGTSPVHQGTYGTSFHVDGTTYFDPRSVVDGGTFVNTPEGTTFSIAAGGSSQHCGDKKACW